MKEDVVIRCINIIRERILELGHGYAEAKKNGAHNPHNLTLAQHCINYLRQLVLCHGDKTLELMVGYPLHAVASEQMCWDWESVYQEVEKNQATHVQNSQI